MAGKRGRCKCAVAAAGRAGADGKGEYGNIAEGDSIDQMQRREMNKTGRAYLFKRVSKRTDTRCQYRRYVYNRESSLCVAMRWARGCST